MQTVRRQIIQHELMNIRWKLFFHSIVVQNVLGEYSYYEIRSRYYLALGQTAVGTHTVRDFRWRPLYHKGVSIRGVNQRVFHTLWTGFFCNRFTVSTESASAIGASLKLSGQYPILIYCGFDSNPYPHVVFSSRQ